MVRALKDLKQQQLESGEAAVEEPEEPLPEPTDPVQGSATSVIRALKQNKAVWSQLRTVTWLNFGAFHSVYGSCASVFEGAELADEELNKGTTKYYPTEIVPGFLFLGDYRDGSDEVVLRGLGEWQSLCRH